MLAWLPSLFGAGKTQQMNSLKLSLQLVILAYYAGCILLLLLGCNGNNTLTCISCTSFGHCCRTKNYATQLRPLLDIGKLGT